MNNKAFCVRHICQQAEQPQPVDKPAPFLHAALDAKAQYRARAVWKVFFCTFKVRIALQHGIMHISDLGMPAQKSRNRKRVGAMAPNAQAERLKALQ